MKVIHKDHSTGRAKLRLETLDDLWHLDNLLEPGNEAGANTQRREETKSDKLRAERGEKKRMFLMLKVEKVEFAEFSDRLRVLGTITEGPQDHGEHHTLNLTMGDELTVGKGRWKRHHLDLLDQAQRSSKAPLVTFVAIDDDEAVISVLRGYGIQVIAKVPSGGSGKQYGGGSSKGSGGSSGSASSSKKAPPAAFVINNFLQLSL